MTARSSSQRLPAKERRERILETAARLFARRGFEGTTVKDLARACGVSESALYKHFASKEALFDAVLRDKVGSFRFDSFLSGLPAEQSLQQTLKTIARKILDVGLEDPLIQKLLVAATLAGSPEAKQFYMSWRIPFVDYLETRFREEIKKGNVRNVDPRISAKAFVGLVNDCVMTCNLWDQVGREGVDKEALIENNVPIFVRGMLSAE